MSVGGSTRDYLGRTPIQPKLLPTSLLLFTTTILAFTGELSGQHSCLGAA